MYARKEMISQFETTHDIRKWAAKEKNSFKNN